jgi:hypothetical protein
LTYGSGATRLEGLVRRALLFALCASFGACKPPPEQSAFRLRLAVVGPLTSITPGLVPSTSAYAQDWVFESLLRTRADGSTIGGLASRFEMLAPSRIRIELRGNASFSDGSAVTVDDVRTSLLDDNLQIREDRASLLIESPSGAPVEPVLRHAQIYKRVNGSFAGTGPFRVVEQTPEKVLLERTRPTPGKISEIALMAFPTPRDTFAHMLAGDADLAVLQDPKQAEFFRGVDRVRLVRGAGANAIAVAMGLKRLPVAARKAIAASLPTAALSEIVFGEYCPRLFATPQSSTEMPRRPLEVAYLQNDLHLERMALAVARALGRSGGELRPLSASATLATLKSQDFDLMIVRPLVWPPSSAAIVWASDSPYNQFSYSNPRVDEAIRSADWARVLQELQQDPPVAFICTPERLAVVDSRVKNPQLGPYDLFETVPEWEIAE